MDSEDTMVALNRAIRKLMMDFATEHNLGYQEQRGGEYLPSCYRVAVPRTTYTQDTDTDTDTDTIAVSVEWDNRPS